MRALQIPETYQAQVRWLEVEMVGTGFLQLIAELEAIHGNDSASFGLGEEQLEKVRDNGLSVLDQADFRYLLTHPSVLLELQQDVLIRGGSFWSEVRPQSSVTESLTGTMPANSDAITHSTSASDSRPSLAIRLGWALAGALATAAALLLMLRPDLLGLRNQSQPIARKTSGEGDRSTIALGNNWGFAKFAAEFEKSQEDMDPPLDRRAYLSQLAEAAKSWSNKRPATPDDLAKRLLEFRRGCSQIILAKHEPIPELDRIWLRKRCREWASALDQHLVDIESGQTVNEVIESVDSTVTKIAAALLGRAETPQEKTS